MSDTPTHEDDCTFVSICSCLSFSISTTNCHELICSIHLEVVVTVNRIEVKAVLCLAEMVRVHIPLREVGGTLNLDLVTLLDVDMSHECTIRNRLRISSVNLDLYERSTFEGPGVERNRTVTHDIEWNRLRAARNNISSVPTECDLSTLAINGRSDDERLEISRNCSCVCILVLFSLNRSEASAPRVTACEGKLVECRTVDGNIHGIV